MAQTTNPAALCVTVENLRGRCPREASTWAMLSYSGLDLRFHEHLRHLPASNPGVALVLYNLPDRGDRMHVAELESPIRGCIALFLGTSIATWAYCSSSSWRHCE